MLKPYQFYSLALGFLAIATFIASIWVIYKLDPMADIWNVVMFYASTGGFVLSLTTFVFFLFRQKFGIREMVQRHFLVSLRQGAWAAILFITAMVLQSYNLFSWMNSIFLVIALTFLEVYFLYNERKSIATNQTN